MAQGARVAKPVPLMAVGLAAGLLSAAAMGRSIAEPAKPAPRCGDFLARAGWRPPHVIYLGCQYQLDRQGKPLRARYRVEGRHAAAAEAYLRVRVGLERLKRVCCYWGAAPRQVRGADGRDYTVEMASGETLILTRAAWRRIPAFEITVETFTEAI